MDCMHIKKYCCIYLGENELYPVFGKVLELFVIPSNSPQDIKWAFYVQKMEDLYFDSHSVHIVSNLFHHYYATCLSFLPLFPVLHLHKSYKSSNTFVILKHYFITRTEYWRISFCSNLYTMILVMAMRLCVCVYMCVVCLCGVVVWCNIDIIDMYIYCHSYCYNYKVCMPSQGVSYESWRGCVMRPF